MSPVLVFDIRMYVNYFIIISSFYVSIILEMLDAARAWIKFKFHEILL